MPRKYEVKAIVTMTVRVATVFATDGDEAVAAARAVLNLEEVAEALSASTILHGIERTCEHVFAEETE